MLFRSVYSDKEGFDEERRIFYSEKGKILVSLKGRGSIVLKKVFRDYGNKNNF